MADVVDLSTLKDKKSDNPDFESLTPEEQEALAQKAAENGVVAEEPGVPVRTAFLVVINEQGEVFVTLDLDTKVKIAFQPSPDDIYGAAAVVMRDMAVQQTSQHTIVGMQQMAQLQAQRLQEAQIAAQLQQAGLKR